jgi:hypothetical protein
MSPAQLAAVEMAAIDLAHAIQAQRDYQPVDEKALLFTLQDLRDAFPALSDEIDTILETLDEVQA